VERTKSRDGENTEFKFGGGGGGGGGRSTFFCLIVELPNPGGGDERNMDKRNLQKFMNGPKIKAVCSELKASGGRGTMELDAQ